ncbi:uncharacterized protein LOC125377299 isoform X1 [Haliotis rufescens]|uniref:uncharacterized protein LOC125377299 isoform X1 n=1 Tax=Haliotis rufescens TaxID=6454 RepID=UPI00201F2EF4|nr:uncharacterized protein LOC125377299 isoform X1 [Haliotis rufescens]XP_048246210.1 uncharacterized protein LOC125377299 isoform X1 [Haliotis rufescens]
MYAIVLFELSDEVEVVPKSWIQGKTCFWPDHIRGSNLTKSIEKGIQPEPDWQIYAITSVLKELDDYQKARLKCRKLEYRLSTDLDTTDVESRSRKRRRPNKYCSDQEEQGEVDLSRNKTFSQVGYSEERRHGSASKAYTLPGIPSLPDLSIAIDPSSDTDRDAQLSPTIPTRQMTPDEQPGPSNSNYRSTTAPTKQYFPSNATGLRPQNRMSVGSDTDRDAQLSPTIPTRRQMTPDEQPGPSNSNYRSTTAPTKQYFPSKSSHSVIRDDMEVNLPIDPLERDRLLFKTLLTIKAMVKNNGMAINRLSEQADKSGIQEESIEEFGFPYKTIEDVRRVEKVLDEKPKFKLLVRHLSGLGGFSVKEVVDRMMTLIFTTQMARQFNWLGKAPKYGMKSLKITSALKEAGKRQATEAEIEHAIRLWVKNAHDRDGGRRQRAERKRERDAQAKESVARARAILTNASDSSDSN